MTMRTGKGTAVGPGERAPGRARRGRLAWRMLGTLALTVALVAGAVQTWAIAVQQRTHSEMSYPVAVTTVRLDTGSATVRIRPGEEGRVVVRQDLNWMMRMPVVSALFEQDRLDVRMRCTQVPPVSDLGCRAVIELDVPPGVAVTGRLSSGSVDVAGVTGVVDLLSTSGEVELADVSGPVTVRTTSGSVRGSRLTSPTVSAAATSGSMQLGFAAAPRSVDIGVTSGSVVLGLPRGSRYDFDGGASPLARGGIDPALADRSSPNKIRVSVTSGSLSVFAKDTAASDGPAADDAPPMKDPPPTKGTPSANGAPSAKEEPAGD
ncbi:DUF4097 family beta strand repeat-containing protein [Kitasatospora sp. NPDC059463]|uniref:DUF4097 family beta strand repeat-containing protein n=1 Tax=unclassified Kitasatospora TaxID=2633591 RepID=UPI0036A05790